MYDLLLNIYLLDYKLHKKKNYVSLTHYNISRTYPNACNIGTQTYF